MEAQLRTAMTWLLLALGLAVASFAGACWWRRDRWVGTGGGVRAARDGGGGGGGGGGREEEGRGGDQGGRRSSRRRK